MVDFIKASPLRTVTESSLRRNLKLQDEEGLSSLPNTKLFENLTLMGYNISPNQKFTFQKGQFSHQWKYLIHTIMQCISPKSTGFNEFSSNIATALVCLATNMTYNFSKMIFDGLVKNVNNKISKFLMYPRFLTMCLRMTQFRQITHTQKYVVPFHTKKLFTTLWVNSPSFSGRIVPFFDTMLVQQGEGLGTLTEPHHTPSSEAQSPSHTAHTLLSLPPVTTTSIPTVTPTKTTPIRQYTRRARIAQSFALPTIADEHASPQRDVSQEEACPTDSGFIADQDRTTIDKSSTLPYDSAPRVTSPAAIEGSMQHIIPELTALCTSLQRQLSELTDKFKAQEVEINRLKERVKMLEDREGVAAIRSGDDAPIKRRSMDEGEAVTKRISDDSEEMETILASMDAATVLASGVVDVPTGSGSIPTASTPAEEQVPTDSDVVPTASPVFSTATVVTPYSRRKGKQVMVESKTPKKQKVQEQIDAQVTRELEEQPEREDHRRSDQIARDAEIARIFAEEEIQIMINGLDRNNETVDKYLQEYHQFASELPIERRIEMITDLVKYQDNYAKIYKYQSQQRKPITKKQKRDYYMAVIRNNLGWKMEDFIPMGSKEEAQKDKEERSQSGAGECKEVEDIRGGESLSIHITLSFHTHQEMDQQYPTVAKIPILDTGKFKQWQFRIQQYLQHEHYALWEVIEFGDSYEVPTNTTDTTTTTTISGKTGTKSGRTVTLTAEDIEKKKNDATKKTKKNLLKQQYGNFRAEGSELWSRRSVDYKSDLDTMSLDDLYNHLKVYESEVQKKTEPNSQNMAFISLAKHSSGNEDGNTACVPTASTIVPTAGASVATISQDTACAYIASQSSGFDKSKVVCFNCHKMGHFARECRAPRSQDRGRRDNFRQGSKVEEQAPKALMEIDGVGYEEGRGYGKLAGLLTASKDLDNLIKSQRSDKNKEGLGYTAVPPPPPAITYCRKSLEEDQNKNPSVFKNVASPITPKPFIKFVKPKDSQSESKTDKKETPKKTLVKYAEQYRKPNKKPNVRGNQRNWNNLKSHQLGPEFVMKKKACFNCGDFNHLAYDYRIRVRKTFIPKPVTHRLYKPSQRPVRTNMNGASPNITSFNKQAHSYGNRPFHKTPVVRSPYRPPCVHTVNRYLPPANRKFSTGSRNFPTANRKFSTASRKFPTCSTKSPTADIGMKGKAVKPLACWSWKPSQNLSNKGNISYLSDYEPFDGGYVSFGQGGCKITRNGTIKTGKLELENVYFVKDLKYNLFSVSQIYDNKNSVLFTDSECIVLGRDFKLLDDANILLGTPRQHNMYSIDLNNIVPHRDVTCLVAKASVDECMLWHRRLGHLNFKTMNKLVRHNLVRGLPTKCFENDHTCTAFLKGKQHKASCKSKLVNSVTKPLHTLHMDLFGPTSDKTSGILKKFITEIENLKDLKVKISGVTIGENLGTRK
nr:putative ribonuclease H-like domain-containing protein [Tanacetum cinerariifolium]